MKWGGLVGAALELTLLQNTRAKDKKTQVLEKHQNNINSRGGKDILKFVLTHRVNTFQTRVS